MCIRDRIGGMTPNDYFSKLSLIKILQIDSGLLIVIGICGWINGLEIISFSVLAFMMYLSSKVNPKLNSLLMAKLPPDILAQTSSSVSYTHLDVYKRQILSLQLA